MRKARLTLSAVAVLLWMVGASRAAPMGTEFTYQGQLKESGLPVTDTCDFLFTLFDSETSQTPVCPALIFDGQGGNPGPVVVDNGLFTVMLDFGADVFTGEKRWLEIEVARPSGGAYVLLNPRQQLTPLPYAMHANTAGSVPGAISGGGSPNRIPQFVGPETLGDSIIYESAGNIGIGTPIPESRLAVDGLIESSNGGIKFPDGTVQTTAAPAGSGTSWDLAGNSGTTPGTDRIGTTDFQALEIHVNANRAMRIEPKTMSPNLIGGDVANTVTAGAQGSTIGGGGTGAFPNLATDSYCTVGGGNNNQAGDGAGTTTDTSYATVSGGKENTASSYHATVSGGHMNTASGGRGTVGGGEQNTAGDDSATVSGGYQNSASTVYSTVGGGQGNTASGPNPQGSATVGGGDGNTASGQYGTVSGGANNTASGWHSAVSGGFTNNASGNYAAVCGGKNNTAGGESSTALGDSMTVNGNYSVGVGLNSTAHTVSQNNTMSVMGGRVGVGTTSPSYTLDVTGDIRATGTIYGTLDAVDDDADTVDGYHAGNASNQVAVSNGNVCTDLNADMLDGEHGSKYMYDKGYSGRSFHAGCQTLTNGSEITFSPPFTYYPVVVATPMQAGVIANISDWDWSGFTLRLRNHDGTVYTGSVYVHWIAIGNR